MPVTIIIDKHITAMNKVITTFYSFVDNRGHTMQRMNK